jgi:hypothetical protein
MTSVATNDRPPFSDIRLFLLLLVVVLMFVLRGDAQTSTNVPPAPAPLPESPRVVHPRPKWDFYVSNGYMLAGIVADERITVYGIRRGCAVEGNPLFRLPNGGVNSGKYYAINLSLAAPIVLTGYLVHRYAANHREARVVMALSAGAIGASHSVAVGQWIKVCR